LKKGIKSVGFVDGVPEGEEYLLLLGRDLNCRVTIFLKILESWKCHGILLRSVKSQGKGLKSGKGQGICVVWEI